MFYRTVERAKQKYCRIKHAVENKQGLRDLTLVECIDMRDFLLDPDVIAFLGANLIGKPSYYSESARKPSPNFESAPCSETKPSPNSEESAS